MHFIWTSFAFKNLPGDNTWNLLVMLISLSRISFLMNVDGQTQYNDAEWIHPYGNQTALSCRLHCFGLFLIIYVISVVSNLGMVILTKTDFRLQTPCNFFPDTWYLGCSINIGPQMLRNFVLDQNTIFYYSCAIQLAFLCSLLANILFCQQCPMTTMWPHVTLCSTQLLCHQGYVGCWWQSCTSIVHLYLFSSL